MRVQAEPLGDDGISAVLRFADGSTASVDYLSSGASSIPKERLELHWEGCSFELDDFRSLTEHGGKSKRLWKGAQDKGHGAEIRAFVQAVRTGKESPVPFDEAVATTRTAFALVEAMRSGAAVDTGA